MCMMSMTSFHTGLLQFTRKCLVSSRDANSTHLGAFAVTAIPFSCLHKALPYVLILVRDDMRSLTVSCEYGSHSNTFAIRETNPTKVC